MKYRKKPVVVDAFLFEAPGLRTTKDPTSEYFIPPWAIEAQSKGTLFFSYGELYVNTLEGTHHVSKGDYIIQGVKGELYACKPDIFELTYEPVEQIDNG